jgi:hypothetical protein
MTVVNFHFESAEAGFGMYVGKESKMNSNLQIETESTEQPKVKHSAAMNAPGFWSAHQEVTRQDGSRAGMRKGSH